MITGKSPTAYVYIRYSSRLQTDGDSRARQRRDVMAWAESKGLAVDDTRVLVDEARSGYTGTHLPKGALGQFIRQVETGKVRPGSVLVVEDFDRISRLPIDQAQDIVKLLTRAGVRVGVVSINQILDVVSNSEFTSLMGMLMRVHLAHEESGKKAGRQKSIWVAKRAKAAATKAVATQWGPRWLDHVDGEWRPNQHARTVLRVYEMCAGGHGCDSIAQMLNREGVSVLIREVTREGARPTPVKTGGIAQRWSGASIRQLIKSASPRGAWQPQTHASTVTAASENSHEGIVTQYRVKHVRTDAGDPVENYYPVVVTPELWQRANNAIKDRHRGGGNKGAVVNASRGSSAAGTAAVGYISGRSVTLL